MQEIMADNKHIALLREHQDGQRVELWHLESGLSQQDPSGPGCMARGMGSGTRTWCLTHSTAQSCPASCTHCSFIKAISYECYL